MHLMEYQRTGLIVGYMPYSEANAYVAKNMEILAGLATVRQVPSLGTLLRHPGTLVLKQFDVVILNWADNMLVTPRGTPSLWGMLKFLLWSLSLRRVAHTTLFVRHNRYPHHTRGPYRQLMTRVIDCAEYLFSRTVTHSGHNATSRRRYVPHPLFRKTEPAAPVPMSGANEYYIAFGRIMPYKHLDSLIRSFPADKRLIIAGPCPDAGYLDYLTSLVRSNIEIREGFIPEAIAEAWVADSCGLILSHSDTDMIASGSYFFAAGLGVPVYSLASPFFDWLSRALDAPGVFTADNLNELWCQLDPNHKYRREAILRYARRNFSEVQVSRAWSEVFITL